MTGPTALFGLPTPSQVRDTEASNGVSWKVLCLIAGCGFILGQSQIYHHLAPFVWVYLTFIWLKGRPAFLVTLVASALGAVVATGIVSALGLVGFGLGIPVLGRWSSPRWVRRLVVGVGGAGLFLLGEPLHLLPLLMAGVAGALAEVLYVLVERELYRLEDSIANGTTLLIMMAALGALIAGLEGWHLADISPGIVIGGVMMLVGAMVTGAAGGAVTGATLGLTLALRGSDLAGGVGILVAGGFVAGWLGERHWRLAPAGLVAGVLGYSVLVRFPAHSMELWLSLAVPAAVVSVLPGSWIALLKEWAAIVMQGGDPPDSLALRLSRLSGVIEEMAQAFHVPEEVPGHREPELLDAVTHEVCQRCSLRRTCWEEDYYRSYRGVMDLITWGMNGAEVLEVDHLSGDLARRCIRPEDLVGAANRVLERERQHVRLRLKTQESRQLAEHQLRGLAALVGEMAEDSVNEAPPRRARLAVDTQVAIAKRPRAGSSVSGDSHLIERLDGGHVVYGLSDGMGVGARAAWESGTAMAILSQMLKAGFPQHLAVRAVNTTLLLRNPYDDYFATLDILLIDRCGKTADLVKVAAAPTFWVRRGRVEVLQRSGLPVGIVPDMQAESIYHTVEPGDVVVLVTDGTVDNTSPQAILRLKEFLEQQDLQDVYVLAETILSYMLGDSEDGRDDAACMVIRIEPHGATRSPEGRGGGEPKVMEWHRVTGRRIS